MHKKLLSLISTLTLSLVALTTPQVSAANIDKRLAGSNRYETGSKIAQEGWTSSDYAVIASGEGFADALCAAPLAKKYNAPILLTCKSTLNPNSKNELSRLNVKTVYIVGGPGVVSDNVKAQIEELGITTSRIYGQNRFETSIEVAKNLGDVNGVVVTNGYGFADSLSIASVAAHKGIPILLTDKSDLPAATKTYLQGKTLNEKYIVGGASVVGTAIESYLNNPIRLGGSSRYKTNAAVLSYFGNDFSYDKVYIASGENYPDALSGSALAAINNSPLILASSVIDSEVMSVVKAHKDNYKDVVVLGGTTVLSDNTVSKIINTETNTDNNNETTDPTTNVDSVVKLGQTVTVPNSLFGTYEITINSIELTNDRNQFDDSNPAEVYKVNYTYKLLSKGSVTDMGLFLYDPFNSVDSTGEAGYSYPNSTSNDPKELKIVGSRCTADTFIAVKNKTNFLILTLDYITSNGSSYVTFNIPTK